MRSVFHVISGLIALVAVVACGSPYGSSDDGGETPLPARPNGGGGSGTDKPGGATPNSPAAPSGSNPNNNTKSNHVLLFGDSTTNPTKVEGWRFDGTSWAHLATVNDPPTRRAFTAAALNGRVVLFGGYDSKTAGFAETWTFDESILTWKKEAPPSASPIGRYGFSMAVLKDRVVLFGGTDTLTGSTRIHNDTWSWNGTEWKDERIAGPSPRSGHAMATLNDKLIVLFGGAVPGREMDETWTFDGATWRMIPSTAIHPPSCFRCTMAPAADSVVVLFGPSLDGQTWTFDGTAWSVKNATGPSKRISSMTSVGGANGAAKIVLFGGLATGSMHTDTWTFDGMAWTLLHPASTPPATAGTSGSLVALP